MNAYKIIKVVLILLFGAALSVGAVAQEEARGYVAAVKLGGWRLPDSGRVVARTIMPDLGTSVRRIYVAELRPSSHGVLLSETALYRVEDNGGITIEPQPIVATSIKRYDADGKVFGYLYRGTCVSLKEKNARSGAIVMLTCTAGFAFYDEDGDGRFERMVPAGSVDPPGKGYVPWLPKWVTGKD